MTSSITFTVGALTFRVREQSSRFYRVSPAKAVPFWNHYKIKSPVILKAISLQEPSSNTLNVGAPTFFADPPSSSTCVVANLQIGHLELPEPGLAGLKTGHCNGTFIHPVVSQ
jgi:hypothetical protein